MKILLIEDNPDDALLIRKKLARAGEDCKHELHHKSRLDDGLQALRRLRWDAVLLDLGLPESQGLDTLRIVRSVDDDVPVIVLTGLEDEEAALGAVKHGAHDFLEKGQLSGPLLIRSLRYAQERHRLLSELRHRATHDQLTGIGNRDFFDKQVEESILESSDDGTDLLLMMLDLNGFKRVNDIAGHDTGDRLLSEVALRLQKCLRDGDFLARLGGDEFGVLLPGTNSSKVGGIVADRIHAALSEPYQIDGDRHRISTSIGIVAPTAYVSNEIAMRRRELMQNADTAMYAAKAEGKGQTRFFDTELRKSLVELVEIEDRLQSAMLDGELTLHFQPIIRLESGAISGFEALCRWNPVGRAAVPPDVFIPIAERTGLILPIGRWVIRRACEAFAEWKMYQSGVFSEDATVHVNVSCLQLSDDRLIPTIESTLSEFDLTPSELTIEITESTLVGNEGAADCVLTKLREMGVGLSIDDFGTGYSSMEQLRHFPFDGLKIDQSFVAQLDDPTGESDVFLEAIAMFATMLNLKTVAEGIETKSQADKVRATGCEYAQGYYFGKPAPMAQFIHPEHNPAELAMC